MNIRRAKLTDAEALWRIQTQAIRHQGPSHYTEEQINAWAGKLTPDTDIIERYSSMLEHGVVFVAEDTNGTLAGFSHLVPETGEVGAIYVHPDHLQHGVGRQLIEALEEEARRLGVTKLHLKASLNAVAFYERVGFKFDHEEIHRFRSGTEMPCVIMTKEL